MGDEEEEEEANMIYALTYNLLWIQIWDREYQLDIPNKKKNYGR